MFYIFLRKCVLYVSNVLLSGCLGVQNVDARVLCVVARVLLCVAKWLLRCSEC